MSSDKWYYVEEILAAAAILSHKQWIEMMEL